MQPRTQSRGHQLSPNDVVLGRVAKSGPLGKWNFQVGTKPYNSVQINSKSTFIIVLWKNVGKKLLNLRMLW